MKRPVRPSAKVLSDKRPPGGPPAPVAAAVLVGVALLKLLAMSPALALFGFVAGGVCLAAVREDR